MQRLETSFEMLSRGTKIEVEAIEEPHNSLHRIPLGRLTKTRQRSYDGDRTAPVLVPQGQRPPETGAVSFRPYFSCLWTREGMVEDPRVRDRAGELYIGAQPLPLPPRDRPRAPGAQDQVGESVDADTADAWMGRRRAAHEVDDGVIIIVREVEHTRGSSSR